MLKVREQPLAFPPIFEKKREGSFFESPWGIAIDIFVKALVILFVPAIVFLAVYTGSFMKPWLFFSQGKYFRFITYAFVSYSIFSSFYLFFKTLLWLIYKPVPARDTMLPSVTIVIPAYNEGSLVEKTILAAARCGYPAELMEIVAVDDGSKDDTYSYMERARCAEPERVRLVRLPKNSGKRHALYAGFHQSKGDVIITIDSDSLIEKGGIHHLVAPFIGNPRVGAVAGNVKVLNRREGFIPRMLGVSFVFSFDFTRACESVYGAVECCPGAFSAYRGDLVREMMDTWLNQQFLGSTCTYGEDRALTNYILRKGFYTLFQSTARVFTMVPTAFSKMSKMFLRWERSNIRESIILGSFITTRYRAKNRFLPFVEFVMRSIRYPVQYYAIAFFFFNLIMAPINVFRYLSVVGLIGVIYSLYYLKGEQDSDFLYGILYCYFSILALQWIFPYACCTLKSRSWLTR